MARQAIVMWNVLSFIGDYKTENDGNPPTREDIARHFGFSPQAADQHIHRLMRKKRVSFDDHGRVTLIGGRYDAPDI